MIDPQARMAAMFKDPTVKHFADASVSLVQGLADGDATAVHALFSGHPDIDDPFHGRRVGTSALDMVRQWAPRLHGEITAVRLEHFTQASGHSGAEIAVDLKRPDASAITSKMVVVSELDLTSKKFLRSRIYYRRALIDDQQHVRLAIKENTLGSFRFHPVVQRYQETLRAGDLDDMVSVFSPDGYLDGHGQSQVLRDGVGMGLYEGREQVRYCLKQMFDIEGHGEESAHDPISVGEYIDHRNMFDDGATTVLEFVIIRPNDPDAPEQAGVSAYEIGDDGLLGAARIYDEGW
ncbi:hypothetical protein [Microbacterium sp.]|uniref:hypothetical protein n=1 Tax=Microbacterium sp. TaxID=51671 RepID=UPI003A8F3F0C